jgi:hypothetical protein
MVGRHISCLNPVVKIKTFYLKKTFLFSWSEASSAERDQPLYTLVRFWCSVKSRGNGRFPQLFPTLYPEFEQSAGR